jgi:hypothetical protein
VEHRHLGAGEPLVLAIQPRIVVRAMAQPRPRRILLGERVDGHQHGSELALVEPDLDPPQVAPDPGH